MKQQPEIRRVGFGRGFRWLLAAAELMGRGGRSLAAVAGLLALFMLLQIVPVLGPAVLSLLTPLLTAGLLITYHRITRVEPAGATTLLAGWHEPRSRSGLLMLGVWLILGSLAAILALGAWLAPQVDLRELERAMNDPEAVFTILREVRLIGGILIAGVILTVVLAALYFAVPLVGFAYWPVTVAGLWSLRAVLVNWAAFLGLTAGLILVFAASMIIFALVGFVLGLALGEAALVVSQILGILLGLFLQVLMAGAQYVAFREVFVWPDTPEPEPGDGTPEGGDAEERVEL